MHWAVAIPFMVCYATALILVVVYNPNPARPFRHIVSWTHRISGLCLLVLPAWNFAKYWRDASLHLQNLRQVWSWTWDDVRWLCLIGPASVSRKITLPWQGKFNAGEKINFMVLSSTYPIYLCTGLLIWFDTSPYLSWLVHFSLAAAVATPLLLGHIFMATVNPDTRPGLRGMITGFVDREWARHHYHLWYVEHFEAVKSAIRSVPSWRPVNAVAKDGPRQPGASPKRPGAWKPSPGTATPAFSSSGFVPRATASGRSLARQSDVSGNT
jgi:formate dehydrogenase gamma subunit